MIAMDKEKKLFLLMEEQIERTREHMRQMAGELGFLHPDVVRCSEQLDELLLNYYAVMGKKEQ